MYTYLALDPRGPATQITDPARTLGVEVTAPALAARCGLGNLDPQHTGGDPRTAAITAALTCPLPPEGAVLVTVRPDMDSVGAMAVLALRGGGTGLLGAALDAVAAVARADCEAAGFWPGPRPVGRVEDIVSDVAHINAMCMDHTLTMPDRVGYMADWLTDREYPYVYSRYEEQVLAEAREALRDLNVHTVADGKVAVVTGAHRLAMGLGYHYAPVVVATNLRFSFSGGPAHVKHTVARWNSDVPMDWDGMTAQLKRAEPGWGGSPSIAGSPQGAGSTLTTDQVAAIVAAHI